MRMKKIFINLFFPMTKTSDDIDYLQHNLWIIDEKLAYHHYLASDMKIKKMEEVENNSGKEPDLIIFVRRLHLLTKRSNHIEI